MGQESPQQQEEQMKFNNDRKVKYAEHINCFLPVKYTECKECKSSTPIDKFHRHKDTDPKSLNHWFYLCDTCRHDVERVK